MKNFILKKFRVLTFLFVATVLCANIFATPTVHWTNLKTGVSGSDTSGATDITLNGVQLIPGVNNIEVYAVTNGTHSTTQEIAITVNNLYWENRYTGSDTPPTLSGGTYGHPATFTFSSVPLREGENDILVTAVNTNNAQVGTTNIVITVTAGEPRINVRGNSQNIPAGAGASATYNTDFGDVNVVDGSQTYQYTIQNTGEVAMTVSDVTVGDTVNYTVSGITLPTTINSSDSTTFSVEFDPTTLGTKASSVSIVNTADISPFSFSITGNSIRKTLTVTGATADNKVYDATTAATITGGALQGVAGGDVVNIGAPQTGTFNNKNVGTSKPVTAALTLTGTDADNYTLTQPSLTANITAKALTVTGATADNKVYDATTAATISGATLVGVEGSDTVSLVTPMTGTFADSNVGVGIAVTATLSLEGGDAGNYTLTQPSGLTANITDSALTIGGTFTANNKEYDGDATATINDNSLTLVGADPADDVTLTPVIEFSDKTAANGKTVSLTSGSALSGTDAGKYTLSFVGAPTTTADITPKELTVTGATADNKIYDTTTAATISGATLVGVEGSDTVSLVTPMTGTFANANVGVGIAVTAILSLEGADAANYTLTQPSGLSANITDSALTIDGTFTANNKEYDGDATATINDNSLTLVGVDPADTVTLTPVIEFSDKTAANGKTVSLTSGSTLGGADAGKYTLSLVGAPTTTADITPKELTVTGAAANNKVYDGNTDATISSATLVGAIGGDTVSLVTPTTGTFANANVGVGISVTAILSLEGADAANYTLTQPTGLSADITATAEPEMELTGNGQAIADGSTTPSTSDDTDFGLIEANASAVEKIFTINNSGTADLTFPDSPCVTVSGSDFTLADDVTSPIAASGNDTFSISITPTANVGEKTANISIANNDSDENPYTFAIKATVQPVVEFTTPCVSSATFVTNGTAGLTLDIEGTCTDGASVYLTNTTTGVGKQVAVIGSAWSNDDIALNQNQNIIEVVAVKNGVASVIKTITINVQLPGAPTVTITNPNGGDTFSTNSGAYTETITGTVADPADVPIVWSNSLDNSGGSVAAGGSFNISANLIVGQNVITVYGTRSGVTGSDSIIINVNLPNAPVVNITEPNGGTDYSVNLGDHSTNIVGTVDVTPDSLVWSNSFDGSGGVLTAATAFDQAVNLSVGVNVITVYATRLGVPGSDSITITVNELPSEEPIITITSPNSGESYIAQIGVHSTNIAGMVNIVPDSLVWSNLLTGTGGVLGTVDTFDFSVDLVKGQNTIVLYATSGDKSATQFIVIGVTDPNELLVLITAPNNGADFSITISDDSCLTNIGGQLSSVPDSFSWNNSNGDSGSLALTTNIFDFPVTLNVGENVITVTAEKAGQISVDNITITVIKEVATPVVTITAPNNGSGYTITGGQHFTNFIGTVSLIPDLLSWTQICSDGNDYFGTLTPDINFTNQLQLHVGTNTVTFYAVKESITGTASMVVTVVEATPTNDYVARVLETWPRYIGESQSGTVEFISTKAASWVLNVVNSPDGSTNKIAESAVGVVCSQGWNLIDFSATVLPVTGDPTEVSNLLELVVGTGPNKDVLPAYAVSIVEDLDTKGSANEDFDGDSVYIKYKGTGTCEAEGRTIIIEGGSAKDKLQIKVKAFKGSGDGVVALCGIICENDIKMIKHYGDLDRLNVGGVMGKLLLMGGNLGRPNGTVRYNATFNGLSTKSKSSIMMKAGKNKSNKAVILANCYANILVGELEREPNIVKEYAGLKTLKITGGNLGLEPYDDITKLPRCKFMSALYADIIMVKPKGAGGKTIDYSCYFTGEGKPGKGSFKKFYLYGGLEDNSENNMDNAYIVCGFDDSINPIDITGTNWIGKEVKYSFGKIQTKAGGLQGTIVVNNFSKGKDKQVKIKGGSNDAEWIVDGKEE